MSSCRSHPAISSLYAPSSVELRARARHIVDRVRTDIEHIGAVEDLVEVFKVAYECALLESKIARASKRRHMPPFELRSVLRV